MWIWFPSNSLFYGIFLSLLPPLGGDLNPCLGIPIRCFPAQRSSFFVQCVQQCRSYKQSASGLPKQRTKDNRIPSLVMGIPRQRLETGREYRALSPSNTVHYIILNNGIQKSNSSIFPRSKGYFTQYTREYTD